MHGPPRSRRQATHPHHAVMPPHAECSAEAYGGWKERIFVSRSRHQRIVARERFSASQRTGNSSSTDCINLWLCNLHASPFSALAD